MDVNSIVNDDLMRQSIIYVPLKRGMCAATEIDATSFPIYFCCECNGEFVEEFPERLAGFMSPEEWDDFIFDLNLTLSRKYRKIRFYWVLFLLLLVLSLCMLPLLIMWGIREDIIAKGGFYVAPVGLGVSIFICMIVNCIVGCRDTKLSEKYFKELIEGKSKPFLDRGLKFKIEQQQMKEFSGPSEIQNVESWVEVKLVINTIQASKMKHEGMSVEIES